MQIAAVFLTVIIRRVLCTVQSGRARSSSSTGSRTRRARARARTCCRRSGCSSAPPPGRSPRRPRPRRRSTCSSRPLSCPTTRRPPPHPLSSPTRPPRAEWVPLPLPLPPLPRVLLRVRALRLRRRRLRQRRCRRSRRARPPRASKQQPRPVMRLRPAQRPVRLEPKRTPTRTLSL